MKKVITLCFALVLLLSSVFFVYSKSTNADYLSNGADPYQELTIDEIKTEINSTDDFSVNKL